MKLCFKCNQYFEDTETLCPHDSCVLEPVGKDALIGSLINDRYVVESVIGKGASGIVYKARRMQRSDLIVAIKVLHGFQGAESSSLDRFMREVQAASRLRNPHIVTIWDWGVTEHGQPFFVMDYVAGFTLNQLIQEKQILPAKRALPIIRQICEALTEAHKQGIVHRDLKPENVILEETDHGDDYVKLLDFGIAENPHNVVKNQIEKPQTVVGSPAYMSPEQCQGLGLDLRTDIYSLGIISFELFTGERPLKAKDHMSLMFMHVCSAPKKLSDVRPDIQFPPLLEQAIAKSLAKKPADRQANAKQFLSEIEMAIKGTEFAYLSAKPKSGTSLKAQDFDVPVSDRLTDSTGDLEVVENPSISVSSESLVSQNMTQDVTPAQTDSAGRSNLGLKHPTKVVPAYPAGAKTNEDNMNKIKNLNKPLKKPLTRPVRVALSPEATQVIGKPPSKEISNPNVANPVNLNIQPSGADSSNYPTKPDSRFNLSVAKQATSGFTAERDTTSTSDIPILSSNDLWTAVATSNGSHQSAPFKVSPIENKPSMSSPGLPASAVPPAPPVSPVVPSVAVPPAAAPPPESAIEKPPRPSLDAPNPNLNKRERPQDASTTTLAINRLIDAAKKARSSRSSSTLPSLKDALSTQSSMQPLDALLSNSSTLQEPTDPDFVETVVDEQGTTSKEMPPIIHASAASDTTSKPAVSQLPEDETQQIVQLLEAKRKNARQKLSPGSSGQKDTFPIYVKRRYEAVLSTLMPKNSITTASQTNPRTSTTFARTRGYDETPKRAAMIVAGAIVAAIVCAFAYYGFVLLIQTASHIGANASDAAQKKVKGKHGMMPELSGSELNELSAAYIVVAKREMANGLYSAAISHLQQVSPKSASYPQAVKLLKQAKKTQLEGKLHRHE